MQVDGEKDKEKQRSDVIKVFKVVIKTIVGSHSICLQPFRNSYIQLLPHLLRLYPASKHHSVTSNDDELDTDVSICVSCLAQAHLDDDQIELVVSKLEEISFSQSWHMRHCCLPYIQVFLFVNLFTVRRMEGVVQRVRRLVSRLLRDEQFEVADMAKTTFSGMIQCELVPIDEELTKEIGELLGKGKLKKTSKNDKIQKRHAGILMLSACLLSSPYNVPDWMPDVVMRLSRFLHDPPPIQQSVKNTFQQFKRTHNDSWQQDKHKFTSEQLTVLTDMLVSPNYYA